MSDEESTNARRKVLTFSACALGGVGVGALGTVLLGSLQPSHNTLASGIKSLRQVVDVSAIKPGEVKQLDVAGLPVLIMRRTQEQLRDLERNEGDILDPTSVEDRQPDFARNRFRSKDPEIFVVQPICTHLQCAVAYAPVNQPGYDSDWRGGFHCPCHAAKFDLAGRVYKRMPAPTNLLVPDYKMLSSAEVLIGHPKDTF